MLIETKNNQAVTTSLQVAKTFGKKNKHVLESIDQLLKDGVAEKSADPMFMEGTYKHPQNHQTYRMYYMNKDGFTLLAMGFTGKKAMQFKMEYINAFNEMQDKLKSVNQDSYMIEDPVKRAEKWIAEQNERKQLEADNKKLKPKALFADAVSTSHSTILVGELAKLLKQNGINIGQIRLFAWLRENGYLIRRKGADYNAPTQRSMEMKLFRTKETTINHSNGHVTVNKTPKVTGKGQQYFINKFMKNNDDISNNLPGVLD
ncbi:phage regulatory protein/antirepressor Ant [Apilactobacillus timberlakei]|uniref:phage regulatory protein/antirepressor Ant n=1 Tax=Apilactobacillus timberlakei TaxID=2008380 RepID=UPI00112CDB87|nr:phage regulatory protein/antirepressor Ant [Apilactobacillus timberlakei]TPR16679.1 phage regulatory protein/antirepressor Ant [Apilactobacillus timberlakei]